MGNTNFVLAQASRQMLHYRIHHTQPQAYIYIYIYIYMPRDRERDRERERERERETDSKRDCVYVLEYLDGVVCMYET